MEDSSIRVSIICNVYNHAKYVRSALDGFLKQKTNFGFEILIHDDASTDESARIIKEYEENYPDLVKPLYQQQNQQSQGVRINDVYQFPRAKGDYIAPCEGDDYWTDEFKLQKQFDYMESHPDCSLCFSNAYCEENGSITRKVIPWTTSSKVNENGIYDFRGIEEIGYIPTVSFFYRLKSRSTFPIIDKRAFRGDGYTKLSLALQGYAYCLPECTCVYRFGVPGSVTTRWKEDEAVYRKAAESYILMFQEFNRVTEGKYQDVLSNRIVELEYDLHVKSKNYLKLRDKKFRVFCRRKGWKSLVSYYLLSYLPGFYTFLKKRSAGIGSFSPNR